MITEKLFIYKDEKYRDFSVKLIPGIDKDCIIGVRMPILRKIAKEMIRDKSGVEFIKTLPHKYHEENILHGLIIESISDIEVVFSELDRFLPYITNWAVCDFIAPKTFKKTPDCLYTKIEQWLLSPLPYTVRFAIGTLNRYYLDYAFNISQAIRVVNINSNDYYVNMMRAWYFATALAKQYESIIPIFENQMLDKWTHNKSIQKARESFRVSKEQKEYLTTLKK